MTAAAIVAVVIIVDQVLKVYVKTHFLLHESRRITSWMYLYFVENSGMAFGVDIAGTMVLTIARLLLAGFLVYYIYKVARRKGYPTGYLICISLIVAGALGNIIDNAFYGLLFSESTPFAVASATDFGHGYAGFMTGRVVDMLYFPLIDTYLPYDWPLFGGYHFLFFAPVFNVADSAITCGTFAILIFYRKCLFSADKQGVK